MTDYILYTLPNGLRVAYKHFGHSQIAHLGLVIDVGMRHEMAHQAGMAHFMEHLLFKGTTTRKAYHILTRLDAVGGEINAYTTKEQTSVYGVFMHNHFDRAAELLKNIVFESVFPEKELEKEKKVVIDEIHNYQDNHEESLYDDFEELLFKNHPLGKNILGTEDSLNSFTRQTAMDFYAQHYTPQNAILSYVGNLDFKTFERKIAKLYAHITPTHTPTPALPTPHAHAPTHTTHARPTTQAYKCLGSPAPTIHSHQRIALQILNNLLGGDGMNCRLNLNIREKYGYVYAIDSGYSPYNDTGIFCINYSTDPKYNQKVTDLVHKELLKLCDNHLTTNQLHQTKQQYRTRVAMGEESRTSLMLGMAKSILAFGKMDSMPEFFAKIDAVTPQQIIAVANEVIHPTHLSSLTYIPKNDD